MFERFLGLFTDCTAQEVKSGGTRSLLAKRTCGSSRPVNSGTEYKQQHAFVLLSANNPSGQIGFHVGLMFAQDTVLKGCESNSAPFV